MEAAEVDTGTTQPAIKVTLLAPYDQIPSFGAVGEADGGGTVGSGCQRAGQRQAV